MSSHQVERPYKFQFITLAGFHTLNHSMFALAITGGESETTALSGSTEESQFQAP